MLPSPDLFFMSGLTGIYQRGYRSGEYGIGKSI
jgi:hypothetical protein